MTVQQKYRVTEDAAMVRTRSLFLAAAVVLVAGAVMLPLRQTFARDANEPVAPDPAGTVTAREAVTMREYEAAVARAAACLESAGVAAEVQPAAGMRPPQLGFAAGSMESATAAEAALARCRAEHLDGVAEAWRAQVAPTRDEAQAAFDFIGACLVRAGALAQAPSVTTPELIYQWRSSEDAALREAVIACTLERQQTLGY